MVIVVMVVGDFVAVQVIGDQRARVYMVVPRLPAGVVVVQHGPKPGQQRDRCRDSGPDDACSQAPDRRESHMPIIADNVPLP